MSPQIFGGGQEAGLRSSTENVPGIVGMGAAAELAASSMVKDVAAMERIRDSIIEGVLSIEGAYLNGSRDRRLCNNAHFGFEGVSGKDLVLRLSDKGIAASAESACSAGSSEPSHVLTAIGRTPQEAMSALRITISRYTTDKDSKALLEVLPGVIASLRS
ncbi:Cysteine desulfurase IscS [bioreactor metagenome]|uniref:Cysteine desulfurase IscS n=1 Tax=bioreactor metagenome TaxID=1076179 RepID=A0A645IJL3_9ZZZZ